MKRLALALLCAVLCACDHATPGNAGAGGIAIVNPSFEEPAKGDVIPGWSFSTHAGEPVYEISIDTGNATQGKSSLRMRRTGPQVYGSMSQAIAVPNLVGKTVRLTAMLKSQDVGKRGWKLFLGSDTVNYSKGQTGTVDWEKQSVDMKIQPYATTLTVGVSLLDLGTGWVDDIQLQVVD